MITEAITKILDLGKPNLVIVDGIEYHKDSSGALRAVMPPQVSTLQVNSLTAVADYINKTIDCFEDIDLFVLIGAHDQVSVYRERHERFKRRGKPLEAIAIIDQFNFSQWQPLEQFTMNIQSMFDDGGDKETVLKYTGNITAEASVKVEDDGVTQKTQVRKGINKREDVLLPVIVTLHPFETFPEITQPARKFVFRIQKDENLNMYCKLLPADGEIWKVQVKKDIHEFLSERLDDVRIIY